MFQTLRVLRGCVLPMALAAVLSASGASAAMGGDHRVCGYRTITVCEYVRKPVCVTVTRYDHCGRPYHVEVTEYRTVKVYVTKRVPVYH
ncbi:MAG: hypothetical protein ACKO2P_16935 [Planctomycetota bacterium]